MPIRLKALEGCIDLRAVPFTEPLGRLLVRLHGDGAGIEVRTAAYEQPLEDTGPIHALRFLDASGAPLPIVARTRPDRVDLDVGGRSAILAFVDGATLMVALPPGRIGIRMETTLPAGERQDDGSSFGYRCFGTILRHDIGADALGRLVVHLDVRTGAGDSLLLTHGRDARAIATPLDPAQVLDAAARRWEEWLARVPRSSGVVAEPALRAAWVLGANTIRLRLAPTATAVVPSKVGYTGLWQWDSYFHAIGLRHLDPALARDQIRLALRWQLPDGMLPDVIHDDGVLAASTQMAVADQARSLVHVGRKRAADPPRLLVAPLTKPPLTALAAWKVFEADRDESFLAEVYPAVVRSHRWWFDRSRPHGRVLPIYLHPYSSGIDDSPIWDLGMPVATPDLPAYLALQADHLALMASALGRHAEVTRWQAEAKSTVDRLVARHWRAARGAFVAIHRGRVVPADTALGLIPIITGRLPRHVADRLVASMTDPGRFWPRFPIPSVALDDAEFDPRTMWRGPTWLFLDYLMVDGLRRAGYRDAAEGLRERTLGMVEQGAGMAEYYHPLDGSRPPRAAAMFSGTAALYLDLLLADRS